LVRVLIYVSRHQFILVAKVTTELEATKRRFFQVNEIVFLVTHVMYLFNFSFLLLAVNMLAVNP
jgi:hypothetical protein